MKYIIICILIIFIIILLITFTKTTEHLDPGITQNIKNIAALTSSTGTIGSNINTSLNTTISTIKDLSAWKNSLPDLSNLSNLSTNVANIMSWKTGLTGKKCIDINIDPICTNSISIPGFGVNVPGFNIPGISGVFGGASFGGANSSYSGGTYQLCTPKYTQSFCFDFTDPTLAVTTTPTNPVSSSSPTLSPVSSNGYPIGSIISYVGSNPKNVTNYLLCDGTSYDVKQYNTLFNQIGYKYGGSGSNFNVPNLQAMFLRGIGNQTFQGTQYTGPTDIGVDAAQTDLLQSHTHILGNGVNYFNDVSGGQALGIASGGNPGYPSQVKDQGMLNARTGFETRPVNYGVYYIIRYL